MLKKVLYVFDDINYPSGVQKATASQISQMAQYFHIDIFSLTEPKKETRALFPAVSIQFLQPDSRLAALNNSTRQVICSSEFSILQKITKLRYAISLRMGKQLDFWNKTVVRDLKKLFVRYDTVCVVSEASKLRQMIAQIPGVRKVQWIHTDYAQWSNFSEWTKMITRDDAEIYSQYDAIVCLNNLCREHLLQLLPHLKDKVAAIPNIVDIEDILMKAHYPAEIVVDKEVFNIVSVGRLEQEKGYDRILNICQRLKLINKPFHWYIVGDGSLSSSLSKLQQDMSLQDVVTFTGHIKNPYSLMAQCNLFAILSHYEGLPATIDEAMVLGLPIVATAVGGIPEQLNFGNKGTLVGQTQDEILLAVQNIIMQNHHQKTDGIKWLEARNEIARSQCQKVFDPKS